MLCLDVDVASSYCAIAAESTIDMELLTKVEEIFKHLSCINGSFPQATDTFVPCMSDSPGVNLDAAKSCFDHIRRIENERLKQVIWESVTNDLIGSLTTSPAHVEGLRFYLVFPFYHEFVNSKNYARLHVPFVRAVRALKDIPRKIVYKWWATQSADYFEMLVNNYKAVVSHIIHFNMPTKRQDKIVSRMIAASRCGSECG